MTEQDVARHAAKRIVNRLEVGQIDAQHRCHPIASAAAAQCRVQAIEKGVAVGQPG